MKIDVRASAEMYVAEIGPKAPEYQMSYETLVDCLTNFAKLCLNVQKTLPDTPPPAHRGSTVDFDPVDLVMARNSDKRGR